MANILIRGQGVAAYGCARLLTAAGFRTALAETGRPRIPAILLGGTTQTLIRDVFGDHDWLRGQPQISKRVVAWGPRATPATVPHFAVVVSEETLAERLRPQVPGTIEDGADWTFYASRPLPADSAELCFGTRRAQAVSVELTPNCDRMACWIESLDHGWLFLIPGPGETGWLLAVGDPAGPLLEESRLVARQIRCGSAAGSEFAVYPRIIDPVCGPGWLSGGTAALAFDPLCGDGTGHAIREAILAAAVIRAASTGADVESLLAHYRARLVAGFKRHLLACREFYATGGTSEWWATELRMIEEGIAWCGQESAFRYQLRGFELQLV